jgi:uncharacterized coiled-coil protein SlyX
MEAAHMQSQVEAETKIKTLQLRVSGQLQAIRVLESQLSDAQATIALRTQQLARAESRLKVLEPRERERERERERSAQATKFRIKEDQLRNVVKAEETIEKYRVSEEFTSSSPSCCHYHATG